MKIIKNILIGLLVVFVGIPILITVMTAMFHSTSSETHNSAAWNHKALTNVKDASRIVGGFTGPESKNYRNGLVHIKNEHQKIGSFTITQVINDEHLRADVRNQKQTEVKQIADAKRDDLAAKVKVANNPCALMSKREEESAADGIGHQASYDAAVSGLNYFEQCDSEEAFVTQGYLLSVKAMAEHYLSSGDSRTDFNQANALLVKCQTTPGIYGTHKGAQCETQEHNNISTQMNWDMEAQ